MTRAGRPIGFSKTALLVGLGVLAGWLALGAGAPDTLAQGLQGLQGGDEPLEINADEGIEWRRNEQLYIARGNARAARGDISVFADVMTAHYRENAAGKSEIDRIDLDGNVRIVSPGETVYGDRGVYDVINGILVLVGDDLRLESGQDLITARDSLEYWEHKNMAVARGEAVATREETRIMADVLTAHFKPGPDKNLQLNRIDAYGNVRISTATEYARGDRGVYYADREFATLTGGVKITREENQMNGEYAEVDMRTGVSRLLAAPPGSKTSKRVHGLLVPRRKPKTEDDS
jgi:lipopolysaccharide export system protein LptA